MCKLWKPRLPQARYEPQAVAMILASWNYSGPDGTGIANHGQAELELGRTRQMSSRSWFCEPS